jgi:hypothetical protein
MSNIVVLVFFAIIIGIINGSPQRPSTLIDTDAKQLSVSLDKLWTFMLNVGVEEVKSKCEILVKCCSSKSYAPTLSRMATNFSIDPFAITFHACFGSLDPAHLAKACPSALTLRTPLKFVSNDDNYDDESDPIARILDKHIGVIKDLLKNIPPACNEKEVYAFLCQTNKKLLQSCIKKTLQKQFDSQGSKKYKEVAKKFKDGVNGLLQMIQNKLNEAE